MKFSDLSTLGLCEFVELFEPDLTHQEKELFKRIENGAFRFDIHYLAQSETKVMSLVALWNLCSFKVTQTALLVPYDSDCCKKIIIQCCKYLGLIELCPKTTFQSTSNKITLNESVIYILNDGFPEKRLATILAGIFCDHYIVMAVDVDNLKPEHVERACLSVTQKNWQCILARKVNETQAINFFHQSVIRDLLERGFYQEAYKESKLSWHPVDPNLPIEEILKQSDDKFMDDVRLFYSTNRQAIFDQLDPVHSSKFLRHIQYEFQIHKIRNTYLDILRKTIEQSIHKGYMFIDNLSKQIEVDKDPRQGITAINVDLTQEDISKTEDILKISEAVKAIQHKAMFVPSSLIIGQIKPMVRLFPQAIPDDYVIACDFDAETTAAMRDKHLLSDRKIGGLSSIPPKSNDMAEAFFNASIYLSDVQLEVNTDE
nr:hypothetical protein [uncultured Acinetobacter sp.]